ncbi:MAG: hypothetical protein AB8I08_16455 [Sandaracinaceae bacterium]
MRNTARALLLPLLLIVSTAASASAQDREHNADGWGRAGCAMALAAGHGVIHGLVVTDNAFLEVPPEPADARAEIGANLGLVLLYLGGPVGLCALSYFGLEQAALAGLWDDDVGHGIATGLLGGVLGFVATAGFAGGLGANLEEAYTAGAVGAGVFSILGGLLGGLVLADPTSLNDEAQEGAFIFGGGLTILGAIIGVIVSATTDNVGAGLAITGMTGLAGLGLSTLLL